MNILVASLEGVDLELVDFKKYTLIMDFKRVQSSPMQSPTHRGNPLIQPLINISKASTPVRTRVVNNAGPMNSTPANINKIPQKIPLVANSNSNTVNKEN